MGMSGSCRRWISRLDAILTLLKLEGCWSWRRWRCDIQGLLLYPSAVPFAYYKLTKLCDVVVFGMAWDAKGP